MLRIGILGLGEGRSTISAVLNSPELKLIAMCDLNDELCKKRSKEFDFHNYTTNYNDLLTNPEIDVIAIYTPDKFHAQHIKLALQHNKHVVCTKPLLDDLTEANELLALCKNTGKKVFVGQSSRFFEPLIKQRSDFENGTIGDLITIESYYHADHRWFLDKKWSLENSFKWLYGGLSHPVDFIRWYMPHIVEIMGYGMLSENGRKEGLKNVDTMHFIMKDSAGKIARVSGTYSGPVQPTIRDSAMSCILRGTEGCSQADYMDLRYAITTNNGEEKILAFDNKLKYFFRFEGKTHHAGEYQNYLEYFAGCLENNRVASPDLVEGIGTIVLLKAMELSIEEGRPVTITEIKKKYNLDIL